MNTIFIHQNFPGQYKNIAAYLSTLPNNQVLAIGDRKNIHTKDARFQYGLYGSPKPAAEGIHPWLAPLANHTQRAIAAARILRAIKAKGFKPDLIFGHLGWGDCMFVKDEFPDVPLIGFLEFFYNAHGADCNFDPEFPSSTELSHNLRLKNATQLVSLPLMDSAISPTQWQAKQYPHFIRDQINIIHEGIDTNVIKPAEQAVNLQIISKGLQLTQQDEVVTFVNRNMEPYRGFHTFMRALPDFLKQRPKAHVLIVGGDHVSYGSPPKNAKTWREALLNEVGSQIDSSRVHFLGKVPYADYLKILQLSTVHVYLTYPFVLSWSMLEAMSAGCLVIGSNTGPVTEVIQDGINGWLTDFFDSKLLAKKMAQAIEYRHELQPLRLAARQTIINKYDLHTRCLPQYIELINKITRK